MVKFLLERIVFVYIDLEVISVLVKLMNKLIEGIVDDEEEGVSLDIVICLGFEFFKVLFFIYFILFYFVEIYEFLLQCLRMEDDKVVEVVI